MGPCACSGELTRWRSDSTNDVEQWTKQEMTQRRSGGLENALAYARPPNDELRIERKAALCCREFSMNE